MSERMNKERAKLDKVYDECIEQLGEGDEVDTALAIDCLCEIWNAWNNYKKQDEWVDVDEKLPDEKGKCYLVTLEFRKDGKWQLQKEETLKHFSINRLLFLRNGEWDVWSDKMRVIAWKPLPEPYVRSEE